MSANSEDLAAAWDSKCIFCKIAGGQEGGTELLHVDEDLVCFRDIRPGALHHYLVVPKKHVGNCKTLSKDDVQLDNAVRNQHTASYLLLYYQRGTSQVKNMVAIGKNVLQKNNVTDLEDTRMGFHWPPFCSISHLHLHVLAPASQLGFLSRMIYRINSYWFITADQLIERLQVNPATS